MTVHVTQENIDAGTPRNAHKCMIADAIRRHNPYARYVFVDVQKIAFSDTKKRVRVQYFTPPTPQKYLLRFDQGQSLKPFAFTLRKPAKVKPMGWAANQPPGASRRGKKYRKLGRKRETVCNPNVVAYTERAFGLRKLAL